MAGKGTELESAATMLQQRKQAASSCEDAAFVVMGIDVYLCRSIPTRYLMRFLREYVRLPLPQCHS